MTNISQRVFRSIATLVVFMLVLRFLPLVFRIPPGFIFILFVTLGTAFLWRKRKKRIRTEGETYETKEYRNLS